MLWRLRTPCALTARLELQVRRGFNDREARSVRSLWWKITARLSAPPPHLVNESLRRQWGSYVWVIKGNEKPPRCQTKVWWSRNSIRHSAQHSDLYEWKTHVDISSNFISCYSFPFFSMPAKRHYLMLNTPKVRKGTGISGFVVVASA